jgi:hypothetical protein
MPKYRTGFERLAALEKDKRKRYAVALKNVRQNFKGFEDFNGYDEDYIDSLSESQLKQIRRYYNTLTRWMEGGQIYKIRVAELPKAIRDKGEKGIDAVKRAAQMGERRNRARFVFLKSHTKTKPRVKLAGDGITPVFVDNEFGLERAFIEIHPQAFMTAFEELRTELKEKTEGATFFKIANVRHELPYTTTSVDLLLKKIKEYQTKYDSWKRWLTGINVYYSPQGVKKTNEYITHNKKDFLARIEKGRRKAKKKRK